MRVLMSSKTVYRFTCDLCNGIREIEGNIPPTYQQYPDLPEDCHFLSFSGKFDTHEFDVCNKCIGPENGMLLAEVFKIVKEKDFAETLHREHEKQRILGTK